MLTGPLGNPEQPGLGTDETGNMGGQRDSGILMMIGLKWTHHTTMSVQVDRIR